MNKYNRLSSTGLTLVETLLALALATFIILAVFIAVPKALQVRRDNERKQAASLTLSQLEQYRIDHNYKYPVNDHGDVVHSKIDEFKDNYLSGNLGARYQIEWRNRYGPTHDYRPPLDVMAISTGHWCNMRPGVETKAGDTAQTPITGDHSKPEFVVVWMMLETGDVYCIDNATGKLEF